MKEQIAEKTLYACLCGYAAAEGDKRFLSDEERSYSAAEVLACVRGLASQLWVRGVRAGSFVALEAARTKEAALLLYALQAVGAVAVLTDPRLPAAEFLRASGTGVPAAYTLSSRRGAWELFSAEGGAQELTFSAGEALFAEGKDARAPAFIIFTSGSTGGAKAVVLSQAGMIVNSEDTLERGWYIPEDVNIALVPLFHVFGLSLVITAAVARHAVYFPTETDIPSVLRDIRRHGVTRMNGVPSLYLMLAEEAEKAGASLPSLRTGLIGGGPCTAGQFAYIEEKLGMTLIPIYGMSECAGISLADHRDSFAERSGSVGRAYPLNRIHILGEGGEALPAGREGEICVDSPFRMLGYYGAPAEAGPLHTGDLGVVDEKGFLHITGRKKDIIIRNGNNVSAADIERALLSLPYVRAAAVVGVADERCGEVPCALVVLREEIGEAALRASLSRLLKKHEMPERFLFAAALPLTPTGKPDKPKIKEMFA